MDTAYISAIAALAGSTIGGLTSLAASWLTQHVQFSAQRRASDLSRRQELYKDFIEEASRCYADALVNETGEIASLVNLYALVSRMRILSSQAVVESADRVVRIVIQEYVAPQKTFRDTLRLLDDDEINPLREFSNACREELQ
jgi:hypothetical protein